MSSMASDARTSVRCSRAAHRITAQATASAHWRMRLKGGYTAPSAEVREADLPRKRMSCVEKHPVGRPRATRPTESPSPIPGKMKTLLPWPIRCCRPLNSTGANGLPVATIARPSDHRIACSAVHSLFVVGFDSGKINGPLDALDGGAHDRFGKQARGAGNADEDRRLERAHRLFERDARRVGAGEPARTHRQTARKPP